MNETSYRVPRFFVRVLCILLGVATTAAAEVYKWTDAHGNVYFSDQPHEGAQQIELKPTTIVPAQPLPAQPQSRPTAESGTASKAAGTSYQSISVVAPGDNSSLRNQQDVAVDVATVPELLPGHQIVLYVDGSAYGAATADPHFTLPGVDRGTHQLAAAIIDENGAELLRSDTTEFSLHRASVNDPIRSKPDPDPKPKPNPKPPSARPSTNAK